MNEDILCEAPGPGGMTCTLPYGHGGGKHAFEVQIPANVAQVIEAHIQKMEEAEAHYRKAARWNRVGTYFFWAGFGAYLVLTIYKAFGP